jgi:hypothetical protein
MKGIKDMLATLPAIPPAVIRTTTVTGSVIDLVNSHGNMVVFDVGVITDGTHTPKLQECATSGGSYTDVAAADQVGTLAALASSTQQKVSYIGKLRFIKCVVTVTGSPGTGGYYGAIAVLESRKQP